MPALMKAAGVEALLVNQSSVEGGTMLIFSKFLSSLYVVLVLIENLVFLLLTPMEV